MDINIRCDNIYMARGLREGLSQISFRHDPQIKLNIVSIPGDSLSYINWIASFCLRPVSHPTMLLGTEAQGRILSGLVNPVAVCMTDSRTSMRTLLQEGERFSTYFYNNLSLARKIQQPPKLFLRDMDFLDGLFIQQIERSSTMTKYVSAHKNKVRERMGVNSTCELFVKYLVLRELERLQSLVNKQEARRKKVVSEVGFFLPYCFART
ncbi:hypothetical protein [Enterobacter cloacae]|uniref:hypothetical protein n=1 Tax=Enterobacter cloacae TaxID=550 RepID=UPI00115CE211|nr:hypothetical protein [Enterobacter cloacae]